MKRSPELRQFSQPELPHLPDAISVLSPLNKVAGLLYSCKSICLTPVSEIRIKPLEVSAHHHSHLPGLISRKVGRSRCVINGFESLKCFHFSSLLEALTQDLTTSLFPPERRKETAICSCECVGSELNLMKWRARAFLSDAETVQMEATGVSSAAVQSCSAEQKALPLPLGVSLGSPSVSGRYGNNQTVTLVIRTVMPS